MWRVVSPAHPSRIHRYRYQPIRGSGLANERPPASTPRPLWPGVQWHQAGHWHLYPGLVIVTIITPGCTDCIFISPLVTAVTTNIGWETPWVRGHSGDLTSADRPDWPPLSSGQWKSDSVVTMTPWQSDADTMTRGQSCDVLQTEEVNAAK